MPRTPLLFVASFLITLWVSLVALTVIAIAPSASNASRRARVQFELQTHILYSWVVRGTSGIASAELWPKS